LDPYLSPLFFLYKLPPPPDFSPFPLHAALPISAEALLRGVEPRQPARARDHALDVLAEQVAAALQRHGRFAHSLLVLVPPAVTLGERGPRVLRAFARRGSGRERDELAVDVAELALAARLAAAQRPPGASRHRHLQLGHAQAGGLVAVRVDRRHEHAVGRARGCGRDALDHARADALAVVELRHRVRAARGGEARDRWPLERRR